ncbi:hypothetical protein [Bathymodiolus thermophilus thioautotrophic gill symbiont]|nr:hypothetical protein [Bathymodiolus thermophilus thioautotrophic gill symbiont]
MNNHQESTFHPLDNFSSNPNNSPPQRNKPNRRERFVTVPFLHKF